MPNLGSHRHQVRKGHEPAREGPPDPELSRRIYSQLAPSFDPRRVRRGPAARAFARLRRRAVETLDLRPGDTVVDVGCGAGALFPLLVDAVGPEGHVIGVDHSREMLARARERIDAANWHNISLLEMAAEEAAIDQRADAALIFLAHDLVRSDHAVANVLALVKPGGRVVAAGPKRGPWWLGPLNWATIRTARRYVTTLDDFGRPWSLIEGRLVGFQVESLSLGLAYVASGNTPMPGEHVTSPPPASKTRSRTSA